MTRLERLEIELNRIKGALQELAETGNHREQAARIFEIRGYLNLFSLELERLQNEHYRTDPKQGLHRAKTRYNSMQTGLRENDTNPQDSKK